MEQCAVTYMVLCQDGSFYTGWTVDLNTRVRAHNAGSGARYTKSRRPVQAVFVQAFSTKEEAMRREYEIKLLTRKEKKKLVEEFAVAHDLYQGDAQPEVFFCTGLEKAPEAAWIRTRVFMEEQGFQNEFDAIDTYAQHAVVYRNGKFAATGRLFSKEGEEGTFVLGRIAVRREFRGQNLGAFLMRALEQRAKKQGARCLELTAQVQARPFYEKLGFEVCGALCMDEMCLHIPMRKTVSSGVFDE